MTQLEAVHPPVEVSQRFPQLCGFPLRGLAIAPGILLLAFLGEKELLLASQDLRRERELFIEFGEDLAAGRLVDLEEHVCVVDQVRKPQAGEGVVDRLLQGTVAGDEVAVDSAGVEPRVAEDQGRPRCDLIERVGCHVEDF